MYCATQFNNTAIEYRSTLDAPLCVLNPNQHFAMLDDGVNSLVVVPADSWAAANYHAHSQVA
jgi:hypothetical protein